MPNSWTRALEAYCYPVNLSNYGRAPEFPGFFDTVIIGDRNSTIAFEDRYRMIAPTNLAAFFEVVYWKLYSQPHRRQIITNRIVDFLRTRGITPEQLWDGVQQFVMAPNVNNLRRIRKLLGIKTSVLALPLTLPSLASPQTIPMIDNQVAKWVNLNYENQSINRNKKLTQFRMNFTSLRENDFPSYLNWVAWCEETVRVLKRLTKKEWRVRDVEMAVFTAQREGIELNALP